MVDFSLHLPIKKKLEEMPSQLPFEENLLTSGHIIFEE